MANIPDARDHIKVEERRRTKAGASAGTAPGALICDRLTAELGSAMLAIIVMPWT
jgi:hypothetical protein